MLTLAAPALAADDSAKKPTGPNITGVPKSLIYAVKMDGPNKHIAISIMLMVENEPIIAIFEGSPLHPNLDALSVVQAEINDGDNETITIKGEYFQTIPNATYPNGAITIKELTVGKFHWSEKYFQYKP
jgi:hypothetical protein